MIWSLFLIMKMFLGLGNSHWLKLKGTAIGTPPAPTYATVFYDVFEFFLPKIFGNNLLLYRLFIDDELVLWKIYKEEYDASELWAFQETMEEWYGLEWNFQVPFLKLDLMDPTIDIKENKITNNLFEKQINL